jgi:hypothetical protein
MFSEPTRETEPDCVAGDHEVSGKNTLIVFFCFQSQLEKLNQIVWPEIMKLAEKQIEQEAAGV